MENNNLIASENYINALSQYLILIEEIATVSKASAPKLLAELNRGLSVCASFHASTEVNLGKLKNQSKKLAAIIYMERLPQYLKEKQEKKTEALAEHFLYTQDDYLELLDQIEELSAINKQLATIKSNIVMSLSAIKNICYNNTSTFDFMS